MMRIITIRSAFAITAIISLSGCATIVNDSHIPLTVSFSDGSNGQCNFKNKRGAWSTEIPTTSVMIRRSDDALVYDCTTEDGRKATSSIRSEMEGGKLAASVVFWDLGITDAITDKHRIYQGNVVIPVPAKESNSVPMDANEPTGGYLFVAGQSARSNGCQPKSTPKLVNKTPTNELYTVECANESTLVIKCGAGSCNHIE